MRQKGITPILILAIVLIVAGIGFVVYYSQIYRPSGRGPADDSGIWPSTSTSATPDSIPSDWKTYKNTTYSYEISYPKDSEIINTLGGGDAESNTIDVYISDPDNSEYMSRLVNIIHFDLLVPAFPESEWSKTEVNINGRAFSKYSSDDKPFDIYKTASVGEQGIEIYVRKNNSLANQIFSTVKFADPYPTCMPRPACLDENPACLYKLPEGAVLCD